MKKPYIVEYIDPWDCFDRTRVMAEDGQEAWKLINERLKPQSKVLRVYHPIFEGEHTVT